MDCPKRNRLDQKFKDAIEVFARADAMMAHTAISFAARVHYRNRALIKAADVRMALKEHRSECDICRRGG